jgi:hypothetical protein
MSDSSTPARTRRKPATATQQLLTPQQASEISGIPYGTLRDLHLRGHLPVVKLPDCRRWWFRREDLTKLVSNSLTTNSAYKGTP